MTERDCAGEPGGAFPGTPFHAGTEPRTLSPWWFGWGVYVVPDVYTDPFDELRAIRTGVSMNEMSPIPKIEVRGPDARACVDHLITRDASRLDVGCAWYTPSGRQAALRVQVDRKWQVAEGVAGFRLRPLEGGLPTFQPGAHIDVHLPNGLVRQYSITNGPGETAYYRIGVKLEPDSSGGSQCLHETVREGDVLAISEPRNNFPLRRDSTRTILVAGGIGITPMLAMAQALNRMDLAFELHCFAQSEDHLAFRDVLDGLGESVVHHLGLAPDETVAEIRRLVAEPETFAHLYVCGPGPMLDATRREAAVAGWAGDAVHFEYFKNTTEIDDSSTFEVALACSALTVTVPSGTTILEVLREHGVIVPSSCEQGACGTCVATVLDGEPDHQDVYLNDSDHEAGERIMTCVSRAKSDRLVLDL